MRERLSSVYLSFWPSVALDHLAHAHRPVVGSEGGWLSLPSPGKEGWPRLTVAVRTSKGRSPYGTVSPTRMWAKRSEAGGLGGRRRL